MLNPSIVLENRSPIGLANRGSHAAARQRVSVRGGQSAPRRLVGLLDDAVFLLLVVCLVPAAILLIGMPVALSVRALLQIGRLAFLAPLTVAASVIVAATAALFLARYLSRRRRPTAMMRA